MKLPEKRGGDEEGKAHDISLGNDFLLYMTPKAQATESKTSGTTPNRKAPGNKRSKQRCEKTTYGMGRKMFQPLSDLGVNGKTYEDSCNSIVKEQIISI